MSKRMTRICEASSGITPAISPPSAEECIGDPSKWVRNFGPRRCSYNAVSSRTCPGIAGSRECTGLRKDRTSAACGAERESNLQLQLRPPQPALATDEYGIARAQR